MHRLHFLIHLVMPIHWITGKKQQREIEDMGADSICIKDMAGLLVPYKATELVQALKEGSITSDSSCIHTIHPVLLP